MNLPVLPWSIDEKLKAFLKQGTSLLLITDCPFSEDMSLYLPAKPFCMSVPAELFDDTAKMFSHIADNVATVGHSGQTAYADESFKLIVLKRMDIPFEELNRMLAKGGHILLELRGGFDSFSGKADPSCNLENYSEILRSNLYHIVYANQVKYDTDFNPDDICKLEPDFCASKSVTLHRFIVLAKKR